MTIKSSSKDRLSGSTIHAVYDGDRYVTSIKEVFRDVFYVGGNGARHRSLRSALEAAQKMEG
jgi:hypothetical protein